MDVTFTMARFLFSH